MKACSFVPAATGIIYELGLEDFLCGVTFECESDKPKVVRSYLENHRKQSREINRIVSQRKADGKSLYYVDLKLLERIDPDVIFSQEVCDVCQIGSSYAAEIIAGMNKQPRIVTLSPRTLDDVFNNVLTVAKTLGKESLGGEFLNKLFTRIRSITVKLKRNNASTKKVMIMEWLNPVYNCGHWIPDQVVIAGGIDELSNPAGYSTVISWNKILEYDPEIIVVAPCGFNLERTKSEIHALTSRKTWNNLSAVKNGKVYLADADLFTRPSTTLVDGIELLAGIFHPDIFEIPERLKTKYLKVKSELITTKLK